tara:strand:- start:14 stop:625 length:612 start_codon:yes stop_codon:yes gene_type:complete
MVVFIYLFLVFTSKPIFKFINKKPWVIVFSTLIFIYTVGFYFMVYKNNMFEQLWLNKIINIIARYCYALFPFVSGAMFYKCKDFKVLDKIKNKNSYAILLIILIIIFHGFFPNLYFSSYLALAFVVCIIHLDFPKIVNDMLEYLSHHSTNIWLVHMFFYAIFFSKYIYYPKYVVLIFLFLVLCSLISSIIINKIYKLIIKKIF